MKISIIAYFFKPDEAIGAVRPENWANWLSHENDVTVITKGLRNATFQSSEVYKIARTKSLTISTIEFFNSIRKKLRNSNPTTKSNTSLHPPTNIKISSGVIGYRMPCLHDFWFFSSFMSLFKTDPELIIATHSPYINLITAYIFCLFHPNVLLWVDFRDLWSEHYTTKGLPPFRKIEKVFEQKILSRANIVSTVSEGMANKLSYARRGKSKPIVIYNSPIIGCDKIKVAHNRHFKGLSLCYTGTIYSGLQDPSPLFKLFAKLYKDRNIGPDNVRLTVASRNPGNLVDMIATYKVNPFVNYVGSLKREDAIRLQMESDILLLMEFSTPNAPGMIFAKVFEYLQTDKPILLIGPDNKSELFRLLNKHNRLINIDDLTEIIKGSKKLRKCEPVDYAELSREQLFSVIESIK